MTTKDTKTVTALCKNRASTEDALRQLEAMGFTRDQISLLMSDATRGKAFRLVEGSKADEGAAAGATFGGVTGAIIGSFPALTLSLSARLRVRSQGLAPVRQQAVSWAP